MEGLWNNMLQFNHIKFDTCPDCGCRSGHATKTLQEHSYGGHQETISFWCGYSYEYSPNFRQFRTVNICGQSEAAKKRKQEIADKVKSVVTILLDGKKVKNHQSWVDLKDSVKKFIENQSDE